MWGTLKDKLFALFNSTDLATFQTDFNAMGMNRRFG